ncbi:TetR/AcrR family transcriptional regulator [Inconstantimicrobium mannanitabidum]|uniref:Uncharacterized protein n=1 Tax=Inconstantimicrobium mannanitabidum TaxID=1604901 RepID=A0ACB5RER8_9CLOT|nr:TetR/AcrR family transcriptional regulator [Clostridium sp. TW13]GKX67580.1 hypothetical protein rsdtw13_28380 [Clostridium sp. TW13]
MHEPKQKRSMETRRKILDTAFELFCKNGYFKTSTNEIAKTANISIGNLYFYFKDKDTIFFEIINLYNESFLNVHEEFYNDMKKFQDDPNIWMHELMNSIIQIHEKSKELNREIYILRFSKPEVENLMQKQHEQIKKIVFDYIQYFKDKIKIQDTEAAITVILAFFNSVVDEIIWSKNKIERERILREAENAVEKYLFY